jgi:DNA-binding MarR family transcriptional regulator
VQDVSATEDIKKVNGRANEKKPRRDSDDKSARDLRLGYLINDVSLLQRKAFDLFMRDHGVTRSQWMVIGMLSRHDGIVQTKLAEMLDLGKASVGGVIHRLETQGLIVRRGHPEDQRAKCLYMTSKAKRLLDSMHQTTNELNQRIFRGLSESERDELVRLNAILRDSLQNLVSE